MPRSLNTYWVTGLPGSGKTTTTTKFWKENEDLKEETVIFEGLKIRMRLSKDTALVGVYDDIDPLRNGTDRYGLTQRNVLKFIWPYLSKERPEVKQVVIEGLSVINRPLLSAIREWSTFHLIKLTVPLDTCRAQHAKRERLLSDRPKRVDSSLWYTPEKTSKIEEKIALQAKYAHKVVAFEDPEKALAYLKQHCSCKDKRIKEATDGEDAICYAGCKRPAS